MYLFLGLAWPPGSPLPGVCRGHHLIGEGLAHRLVLPRLLVRGATSPGFLLVLDRGFVSLPWVCFFSSICEAQREVAKVSLCPALQASLSRVD